VFPQPGNNTLFLTIGHPACFTSPDHQRTAFHTTKQANHMNWEDLRSQISQITWRGTTASDLESAFSECLLNPAGLPPLDQMLVAGDLIAIAMSDMTPTAAQLLEALLTWLSAHAVSPEHIAVVLPMEATRSPGLAAVEEIQQAHPGVNWVKHAPEDPYASAYLAADAEAHPIYFNRALIDADVVIGIRSSRGAHPKSRPIAMACELYPRFTNQETWDRLFKSYAVKAKPKRSWNEEIKEAEDWLGFVFWIESFHAPDGALARLQSGDHKQLTQLRPTTVQSLWTLSDGSPPDLVVIDVPECLGWTWAEWLTAIDQVRRSHPEPPKVMLRGTLPNWPQRPVDLPQSPAAEHLLSQWIEMECERLAAEESIWVLGPTLSELSETPGWFWLDNVAEAAKLIERFETAQLVSGAFVAPDCGV
jgi:hypothetical protein